MAIPDEITFGPDGRGGALSYGNVRAMSDFEKIHALKLRLDGFLVDQVSELGADNAGNTKVYSPFPLAVMTCVGIEALGRVMYRQLIDGLEGAKKKPFIEVAKGIDSKLSRQLTKDFKRSLKLRWPGIDASPFENAAHIIYTFFRNKMIHGYFGQAVYLTDLAENATATWEFGDGYLILSPYWFWDGFKKRYSDLFIEALKNQRGPNPRAESCLLHLAQMLK
jgi:hypothetical protein